MKLNTKNDEILKYAIDTNILVYAYDNLDNEIVDIAIKLIKPEAQISNHSFQEFLYLLHKKRKVEKKKTFKAGVDLLNIIHLTNVNKDTYRYAYRLMMKHNFQLSDSIIVADAILNECNILYSRDMQNGQIVDKKLKIINPFETFIK